MDSSRIRRHRLYGDLSTLFPLISVQEDYAEEAGHWRRVLEGRLGPGRHSILELGVGAGHNLSHLGPDFQATAVDRSEAMLTLCRRLNPSAELHAGDMRTVRLGRRFEAVLIHDAVSYLLTEADLRATLATAAAHLEPGGVLVMSPDLFRDTFRDPSTDSGTRAEGGTELTWFEYTHDPDPADTRVEAILVYFIRESDDAGAGTGDALGGARRLRIEHDRHEIGLFSLADWERLMGEAGFAFEELLFLLEGGKAEYRLLVGTLRAAG